MRTFLLFLLLGWMWISFSQLEAKPRKRLDSFQRTEDFWFKIHYGFISAGYLKVQVDTVVSIQNGQACYKAEMLGATTGALGWFADIYDRWTTYIDTSSKLSVRFERRLKENSYKKYEVTQFDRSKNLAIVSDQKNDTTYTIDEYAMTADAQDMVSAYFELRHIDLQHYKVHDTLYLPIFLDKDMYKLPVVYMGKERIRTALGKMRTVKFSPIMPPNRIFAKENPIISYFSDDVRRIPVKIKAKLVVGAVEVDLEEYKGYNKDASNIP